MEWSTVKINGISMTHVQQASGTNHCFIACMAMIAANVGYWPVRLTRGSELHRHAAFLHRQNPENGLAGSSRTPMDITKEYGVAPGGAFGQHVLLAYGWNSTAYQNPGGGTQQDATAIETCVNSLRNDDSCIVSCGFNRFHAIAIIRKGGCTYVMNPSDSNLVLSYPDGNAVQAERHAAYGSWLVDFNPTTSGRFPYHASINECYFIPSQSVFATFRRWLTHRCAV